MITHYWSRMPGKFVNAKTGEHRADLNLKYEGTVREWYETLIETIVDVNNAAFKEGVARQWDDKDVVITCSPVVGCIFESSVLFKLPYRKEGGCPVCSHDAKFVCMQTDEDYGTIANQFKVVIDRTIPPDVIKVGDYGQIIVLDGYFA